VVEYLLGKEEVTSSNLVTGFLLLGVAEKGVRFASEIGAIHELPVRAIHELPLLSEFQGLL
jgi:hypothetical protein